MTKERLTTILIAGGLTILFILSGWAMKCSRDHHAEIKASKEQNTPIRAIYVGNPNIHTTVDVVEIDDVEYLIASTSRGVSICRK